MADSELVHMTPHCREFCVMCYIAGRIACSSVENIEEEDGSMPCWMICEPPVTAQPIVRLFWILECEGTVSWWCFSYSVNWDSGAR